MKHLGILALLIIPLMLMACNRSNNNTGYDYMGEQDMYYTKFYKAFSPNPILSDSMTNQLPAKGTISRGNMPFPFPGGNIGELAVNGSVNDIAMCGAIPSYLSLSFILEEGLPMADFWEILLGIKKASEKAGVKIVTGDTKVVEKGKGDQIFINTTGIGAIHPKAKIHFNSVKAGDKIIVSGKIATHGIAILSQRKGLEFETTIESDSTNLNHTVKKLLDIFGDDIHFLRDPTRGGVATVMNEVADQLKLGISLLQKNIPVDEQVEGACEMLGLDPLYVANEGLFITIVPAAIAPQVIGHLQQDENGTSASIIGDVVTDHPGKVILSSTIGGKRIINYLTGEQLPRIC